MVPILLAAARLLTRHYTQVAREPRHTTLGKTEPKAAVAAFDRDAKRRAAHTRSNSLLKLAVLKVAVVDASNPVDPFLQPPPAVVAILDLPSPVFCCY